jgi:hypothetical protein
MYVTLHSTPNQILNKINNRNKLTDYVWCEVKHLVTSSSVFFFLHVFITLACVSNFYVRYDEKFEGERERERERQAQAQPPLARLNYIGLAHSLSAVYLKNRTGSELESESFTHVTTQHAISYDPTN